MDAGLADVARSKIRGIQIKQMDADTLLVDPIDGTEPVNRGDEATVFRRPLRRVVLEGFRRATADQAAVMFCTARKHDELWLGAFGPIHRPAGENRELVDNPQNARAGVRVLNQHDRRGYAQRCDDKFLFHQSLPASYIMRFTSMLIKRCRTMSA